MLTVLATEFLPSGSIYSEPSTLSCNLDWIYFGRVSFTCSKAELCAAIPSPFPVSKSSQSHHHLFSVPKSELCATIPSPFPVAKVKPVPSSSTGPVPMKNHLLMFYPRSRFFSTSAWSTVLGYPLLTFYLRFQVNYRPVFSRILTVLATGSSFWINMLEPSRPLLQYLRSVQNA